MCEAEAEFLSCTSTPLPRVSVLVPVYQGAAHLGSALDSLQAQTFPHWEAVVADDGSTDGTADLLRARAAQDSRIRPVFLPHGGIVAALHGAFAAARPSPLFARLDADDTMHPERLARQAAYLDAHPDTGLVSSAVRFGGDAVAAEGFARHVDWLNSLVTHEDLYLNRFRESPFAHPAVMFRRSVVEAHGFYAQGPFPEDYELWLRWLDAGVRMHSLPEALTVWNDPPGRLTRTHANYSDEAFADVRARYLARHLARTNPHHPEVWLVGAGRTSRRRAMRLTAYGVRPVAIVDIDPRKIGNRVQGLPVVGRTALPEPGKAFVLVFLGSRGAGEECADFLRSIGYAAGRDFLLAS